MGLTVTNLDSKESAFFARETEFVKSRTYDAKTPALKGLSLVPQATDLPEGISEVTYRRYSEAGEAKVIANYAKDFPRVDVFGEEDTVKVIVVVLACMCKNHVEVLAAFCYDCRESYNFRTGSYYYNKFEFTIVLEMDIAIIKFWSLFHCLITLLGRRKCLVFLD